MDKKNNIMKIFIVIICLCGVALFALYESGTQIPFIQTYKNNFKKNISGITNMMGVELPIEMQLYLDDMSTPEPKPTMTPADEQMQMYDEFGYPIQEEENIEKEGTTALTAKKTENAPKSSDNLPVALDFASNAKFAVYAGNVLCASETSYSSYSANGKQLYSEVIQMQEPKLTVKGDYVLINETGAKKICLYKNKKLLYSVKTEGNIVTADLSENGDVIAVTEKEYFKGQVVVFNRKGKIIYAWDSGSYDILDAAISNKRQVAVSMLNSDEGADSFVSCFSVKGKTKYKTELFKNSLIFDLSYSGEKLIALCDDKMISINSRGKTAWEYKFEGKALNRFATAQNGYTMLLFASDSTGEIITLSPSGKAFGPVRTESMPDCIDIKSGKIAYNSGRDIVMTNLNGKKLLKAFCDSDVKQIKILDSKYIMAVYNSSIQTKKLSKPEKNDAAEKTADNSPVPQDNDGIE